MQRNLDETYGPLGLESLEAVLVLGLVANLVGVQSALVLALVPLATEHSLVE